MDLSPYRQLVWLVKYQYDQLIYHYSSIHPSWGGPTNVEPIVVSVDDMGPKMAHALQKWELSTRVCPRRPCKARVCQCDYSCRWLRSEYCMIDNMPDLQKHGVHVFFCLLLSVVWETNNALLLAELVDKGLRHTKRMRTRLIHQRQWSTARQAQQHQPHNNNNHRPQPCLWCVHDNRDPMQATTCRCPDPSRFTLHVYPRYIWERQYQDAETNDTDRLWLMASRIKDTFRCIRDQMGTDIDWLLC